MVGLPERFVLLAEIIFESSFIASVKFVTASVGFLIALRHVLMPLRIEGSCSIAMSVSENSCVLERRLGHSQTRLLPSPLSGL